MDSSASRFTAIQNWLAQRNVRLFLVASIVAAAFAIIHVNQSHQNAPMQELLQGCKLQPRDLQQLQLAFGEAGLDKFSIKDGVVLVPKHEHATYLAAASKNHGLAGVSKSESATAESHGNPFMSRSQLDSLDHARRKSLIRDMIVRLPFVDQAWFEMDRAKRTNAFETPKQTAVISIRKSSETFLTDEHVKTIKRMIDGAVADLAFEDIIVIDLDSGQALHGNSDQLTAKEREMQQIAFNQKRFYESRFREALADYQDLELRVDVKLNEVEKEIAVPQVAKQIAEPLLVQPKTIAPGANGVASIENAGSPAANVNQNQFRNTRSSVPALLARHQRQKTVELARRLEVSVQVPESTVFSDLGQPVASPQSKTQQAIDADLKRETDKKFAEFKDKLTQRLLPLFPENNGSGALNDHSLSIALLPPQSVVGTANQYESIKALADQHWPSIAVLGIGAVLLMIVGRQSKYEQIAPEPSDTTTPFAQEPVARSSDGDDAEARLTNLIEQDPDSAAKIIETWIRDAA